jgi:uncharacterized lipoprotein YddW (UPF0748 family)
MNPRTQFLGLLCACAIGLPSVARAQAEFRALWADTFHAGMRNSNEVSQLVAAARSANCNAIIVEVRKRCDAYYNSSFEPKAADVSPQSFDPLADLVAKAHSGGPRIEVHAWITTYLVWNNATTGPSQTNHPFYTRPEWLSRNNAGTNWDGANYQFDQSLPGVQKHIHNVAMDLISRYDIDGFQLDYVRYSGNTWGYHSNAVARFQQRFNTTGTPASNDPQWLQFRRDQVSALVRKIYLDAIALKPQIKISAATICFAPGITTTAQWPSSAAWSSVLQDWRGWMQEGILDLNIPMMYFDHRRYSNAWTDWSIFAKNHAYSRQVALGEGAYLNILSNVIHQTRSARTLTAASNGAAGVAFYSYAVPETNLPPATVFAALTSPSGYDPNPVPVFASAVSVPAMPWKTAPTAGHLKGTITSAVTGLELDGALVSITGPVNAARTNDATGFYGFANLPPGNYSVTASFSNLASRTLAVAITTGAVATLDFALNPPGVLDAVMVFPGRSEAVFVWATPTPMDAQIEFGITAGLGSASLRDAVLLTNHAIHLTGLAPGTDYFYRAVSRAGSNTLASVVAAFRTAGEMILDNVDAAFTGGWTPASSAADKYGTNYAFASTTGGAATARYVPDVPATGLYDVQVWYSQGGNRSAVAPFLIQADADAVPGSVNQTSGGGAWRTVATNLLFQRGTGGFFQWSNNTAESGRVVIADAVRFLYATNQEPPAPGTVPAWWAQAYFGGPVSALADHDADGVSTASEYLAGTNPRRADSRLVFRMDSAASNAVSLSFAPWLPGRGYELEGSTNLTGSNGWHWIAAGPLVSTNNTGAFVRTNVPPAREFYRLRIRPEP